MTPAILIPGSAFRSFRTLRYLRSIRIAGCVWQPLNPATFRLRNAVGEAPGGFADKFREEGMRKRMQQGEALVLVRLMQRRFGALAPQPCRRIEQADPETLLRWSERVLTAGGVEAVLH